MNEIFGHTWYEIGKHLLGNWNARTLIPACAFWLGGLLIWVLTHNWEAQLWQPLLDDILSYKSEPGKIEFIEGLFLTIGSILGLFLLAIFIIVLLAISIILMEWITPHLVSLVEGYWHPFLNPLRNLLVTCVKKKRDQMKTDCEKLVERRKKVELSAQ